MDLQYQAMLNHWQAEIMTMHPNKTLIDKQSFWEEPLLDSIVNNIPASANDAYN